VLFAGLRENVLEDQLETSVETVEDAITYKSTVEYLNERKRVFNVLNNQNIMTLDVVPNKLPFYLVNKYLDVKGRGVL
jgi:molybdopterin converting factor small subunit